MEEADREPSQDAPPGQQAKEQPGQEPARQPAPGQQPGQEPEPQLERQPGRRLEQHEQEADQQPGGQPGQQPEQQQAGASEAASQEAGEPGTRAGAAGAEAPAQPQPDPAAALAECEQRLAASEQRVNELVAQLQRSRADFDNYRKRMMQEQERWRQAALAEFSRQILPALDNLERALKAAAHAARATQAPQHPDRVTEAAHATQATRPAGATHATRQGEPAGADALASLRQGVELTARQFSDALQSLGVEPVPALGETFDPRWHEAVAQELSSEHRDGEIIEEWQKGYRIGEQVVRPALVKVARAPQAAGAGSAEEDEASHE